MQCQPMFLLCKVFFSGVILIFCDLEVDLCDTIVSIVSERNVLKELCLDRKDVFIIDCCKNGYFKFI